MAIKSSNEGGLIPPLRAIPKKPSDPNNKYLAPDGGNNGKPSWKTFPEPVSGLPSGATAKQFDVCEDGEPKQYWFLTWEEEPNIS